MERSRPGAEKRALGELREQYRLTPTPKQAAWREPRRGRSRVQPGRPKRIWLRLIIVVLLLVAVSGGLFGYKILSASNKITVTERSLLGQLKDLLFKNKDALAGEKDDRINMLLIAVGGEGHSGEELADTIMLLSFRPSNKTVALLSIPRDLYVQVPGENYYTKINSVHAQGEAKKKNGGPPLLKEKVEEMTGLPIHYYGRVDFTAFKHIVDAVGGIDITIQNSFVDYWHNVSFPAGTEHMNGERALAYVRARYIEGPEGGDFKRATRQQQVLLALQQKVFSVQTALDFSALNGVLNSIADNVRTDLELWEMKRLYELARSIDQQHVHSVVLTTGPKGVLVGSTEILGGKPAAILKPRTNDYSEIQAIARDLFSNTNTITASPSTESPGATSPADAETPTPSPETKITKIEVRNGTTTTGLAAQTKELLEAKKYPVSTVGNATDRAVEKTTVYALNLNQADAAKEIADFLEAQSDSGLPKGEAKSEADILIILGKDAVAASEPPP